MDYDVSLDILSGLPNPTWRLTADEADRLQQWLSQLSPTKDRPAEPPDLGYRGLTIRRFDAAPMQVFEEFVLTDSSAYADPDRQLEEWLLKTGKPHVANKSLWKTALHTIRGKQR
jgi:hypothetical protein